MCCCCRRPWRANKLRDYIYCTFTFVFNYAFLPAVIVFELAWSLLLASSSVKTFTFMATGSHTVINYGNSTLVDDSVITPPEIALGALVMLCSGVGMAIFMWLRAKAKRENRRGRFVPYKVDPDAIPLSMQGDSHAERMMAQVDADTYGAFVIDDDDDH